MALITLWLSVMFESAWMAFIAAGTLPWKAGSCAGQRKVTERQ